MQPQELPFIAKPRIAEPWTEESDFAELVKEINRRDREEKLKADKKRKERH